MQCLVESICGVSDKHHARITVRRGRGRDAGWPEVRLQGARWKQKVPVEAEGICIRSYAGIRELPHVHCIYPRRGWLTVAVTGVVAGLELRLRGSERR